MGDNEVKIRVGADLSRTQEAVGVWLPDQFHKAGEAANDAFGSATRGIKSLDGGILNAHQSTHLLAEELGIHLPRAVVGGISEMLPKIGDLGGALLGVFAAEQAYEWGKRAVEAVRDLQSGTTEALDDIGKAAEATAKRVHGEIEKIFSDFKSSAGAQLPMQEVELRAQQLTRYYQAFLDLQKAQDAMKRPTEETLRVIGAAVGEGLTNIEDVRKKLDEVSTLQLEQHRRLAEVVQKESHASCEVVIHDEELERAAINRTVELRQRVAAMEARMAMQRIHTMQEAGKGVAQLLKSEEAEAATKERMARADLSFMVNLERLGIAERNQIQDFEKLLPRVAEATTATVHLAAVRKELIWITQDARTAQEQWVVGLKEEIQAVEGDLVGNIQSLTQGLVGLIGGRKAQAGIEAIWETARGIALLAEGSWPPNPAAIIASGLHFEAAAQYAVLAGSGSHRRSASGAGAGESSRGASSRDAGGGQSVNRSGGGSSGGGSSQYSQTILQISGKLSTNGQQQLAAWMGMGSAVGLFKFEGGASPSAIAAPRY